MEKKILKKLEDDTKVIKVLGQGCLDDCHIVEKREIRREYYASLPCYTVYYEIIADYYNASWTTAF